MTLCQFHEADNDRIVLMGEPEPRIHVGRPTSLLDFLLGFVDKGYPLECRHETDKAKI